MRTLRLCTTTLRFDTADHVARLSRSHDGARAAAALAAAYRGERIVSIGLGGLEAVRERPALALVREAELLVSRWEAEARIEIRSLRRPVRRLVLGWIREHDDRRVVAAGRRKLVLARGKRSDAMDEAEIAVLSSNRRRMLRLAERDGGHCVWCRTPLSHESPRATIDHVRCRSDGGADALANLVLACADCNNSRADSPAAVWLRACLALNRPVDASAVWAAIGRSDRHHGGLSRAA
jgi:5-methylcytosine-specific restriction endonuclease McrA